MYEEINTVISSLNMCGERGYCLLDAEMKALLIEHLSAIVDVLHAKYPRAKYPGNQGKYLRAKSMALILEDILAAKDVSEFEGYKRNFGDKFTALLELYELKGTDENYRQALGRVRNTFTGEWIGCTGANLVYYNKQKELAENDSKRANELPDLQKNVEKAIELNEEPRSFIHNRTKLEPSIW